MRYADLPSSPGIFPIPLLDSALTMMYAASNDPLVQQTLHPPSPWWCFPRGSAVAAAGFDSPLLFLFPAGSEEEGS